MPKTGYPTPDNPIGEMDFVCKSIFIPNDDAFVAVLAGQLAEATNAWYWKKAGTMTPEQAAEYMSNALALIDFDEFCGGPTMSCEDVADCIETDIGVQSALDENTTTYNDRTGALNPDSLSPAATENTTIINNRFPPAERDVPAHTLTDCNLDELWGGIYFMVQQLDNTGRDWLEQAVASGDKWQRAASIAKNIPIIGSLASTALEQLAEVAQDLLNLYNGYSTEAALQDIACDLFEMVCAECRYPTFQEIADYYAQNSTITGGNLTEISLKAMVDFLIGSSLAISQLAYHTIISMVLFTLYIGSEFVGLRGSRWISIWLDNGEEFANDAWMVLCDGCEPGAWTITYDFTVSDGGWVKQTGANRGEWVNGIGWRSTQKPTPTMTMGCYIYHALPVSCEVQEIRMDYNFDGQTWSISAQLRDNPDSGTGAVMVFNSSGITTSPNCGYGALDNPTHRNNLLVTIDDAVQATFKAVITKIVILGIGEKPTGYQSEGESVLCP